MELSEDELPDPPYTSSFRKVFQPPLKKNSQMKNTPHPGVKSIPLKKKPPMKNAPISGVKSIPFFKMQPNKYIKVFLDDFLIQKAIIEFHY